MRRLVVSAAVLAALLLAACTAGEPKPFGAVPSEAQIAWQQMEMNMFCHFGPNTFTGNEWGDGREDEDIFFPTALDCSQWVAVAKAGGFKGIIITAKHHDGFCLWPSQQSDHTVRESRWQRGGGDVLRELSDACHNGGVQFGVYVSPWDRNAANYGTAGYNTTFAATLREVLGGYGEVFEQWFDGANGEGPNGRRQEYDWSLFNRTVGELQPQAVVFSDVGPGCRWIGNERGEAGRTCWSTIDPDGFEPGHGPGEQVLNCGVEGGSRWIPGEADVSIRDGWFYRESEHPKSVDELLRIYYNSVGRNAVLLLNVPPDTRGLVAEEDSVRIVEFRQALDQIFANDLCAGAKASTDSRWNRRHPADAILDTTAASYWMAHEGDTTATITLALPARRTFNRLMLQEPIAMGQRIAAFTVEVLDSNGRWHEVASETTVGYKRIVLLPQVETDRVKINITRSLAEPALCRVALYHDTLLKD